MAETAAAKKKREAAEAEAMALAPDEPVETVEHNLNIVQLISLISKEAGALAPEAKGGVPFPFRGIDGTINHLSPYLQKYGVVVVPRVIKAVTTPNAVGNRTVKTTEVETEFTFYAPDMQTSVTATTAGLADDFADRSAAQAQSVAYRIALLQTFTLPTQSPEPEQTGEVVLNGRAETAAAPATPPQPRSMNAVDSARQKPAEKSVEQLFLDLRAEAGKRNLTGAQMNEYAKEEGATTADWIKDRDILTKVAAKVAAVAVPK